MLDPRPRGQRWQGLPEPLQADLERLGEVLDRVLSEAGGATLVAEVEWLRSATVKLRGSRGEAAAAATRELVQSIGRLSPERAEALARAFTVHLHLVNLAEERHRARTLARRSREQERVPESVADSVAEVRERRGEASLERLLARLSVRPVLTAHPTEARRRAIADSLRRIGALLELLEGASLDAGDRREAERALAEQVTILWRTAQLRQTAPTPVDEVRTVAALFDETLFRLVPRFYRDFERALVGPERAGTAPPSFPTFLSWGSWVGGDREGNPSVTAEVTREGVAIQAQHALSALREQTLRVGRSLTLSEATTPASPELLARLERDRRALPRSAPGILGRAPREPHRQWLLLLAERLEATRGGAEHGYGRAADFLDDLRTLQASLDRAGAPRIAYGQLQHLVWQAETFGFTLASLEIRQHADVHRRALRELLRGEEPSAPELDRLAAEGWPPGQGAESEATRELLATLATMAEIQGRWGEDACRRYVVSFSRQAFDLVAVRALGRLAAPGGQLALDVVPLFESRADLARARAVLEEALALPGWRRWLASRAGRLEVMLGYSDAAKDAGFLAANLALYRAQGELSRWARDRGIELTLFHGRGGAVGRGGGPAGRAIRGQAPGSVSGHLKVTEQGEVVFARYGNPAIALRHLEQVTSAVLLSSIEDPEAAGLPDFSAEAELMAEASEAAYRGLVERPGFGEFFDAVSPLQELGQLRIGSRPGRRAGYRGLEGLRAISWVFAWSQTRCNLPGWYGLGSGLEAVARRHGPERLAEMNRDWPFFRSLLENSEMSLAKADPMIAGLYLERGGRPELVDLIREEFRRTRRQVTLATGHQRMLAGHPVLRRAVDLRNPYVDALSFLQLRFLEEARSEPQGARRQGLVELVLQTVNGVAAGLQNTG